MIELLSCGAFSYAKEVGRENQDAFLLPKLCGEGYLFAIADGVGSYFGAKEVALVAIDEISVLKPVDIVEPEISLKSIKSKISQLVHGNIDKTKAATTLSYCYIDCNYLHIIHVGDTRVYLKNGIKLKLLTKDHTQHQELLDDGLYNKKELKSLPGKNLLTAAISKSLPLRYQHLKIPIKNLIEKDGTMMLVIMSDGAHNFWEYRPRFSEKTMNNVNTFTSNMYKRIQRMGPTDDYSLIAVSFNVTENE